MISVRMYKEEVFRSAVAKDKRYHCLKLDALKNEKAMTHSAYYRLLTLIQSIKEDNGRTDEDLISELREKLMQAINYSLSLISNDC